MCVCISTKANGAISENNKTPEAIGGRTQSLCAFQKQLGGGGRFPKRENAKGAPILCFCISKSRRLLIENKEPPEALGGKPPSFVV